MSRMTEALEKQSKLDELQGADFKDACDKGGFAPIVELKHQHLQVIDMMLANPKASTKELAEKSDLSAVYITKLRRTPLFIIEHERAVAAVHSQFKAELVDEVGQATKDMLRSLSDIFTSTEESASDKIKAAKLLVEGDAFSLFKDPNAKSQPQAQININNAPQESAASSMGVTKEMLAESRARRVEQYQTGDVVDGEVQEGA